jgi:pyruvate dehydrogenase E1 component beta subunit
MDYETILTSVRKTNRLVVLEKLGHLQVLLRDYLYCSRACFDFLDAPIQRITTADSCTVFSCFVEWLPNAGDVVKAVKKVMYK